MYVVLAMFLADLLSNFAVSDKGQMDGDSDNDDKEKNKDSDEGKLVEISCGLCVVKVFLSDPSSDQTKEDDKSSAQNSDGIEPSIDGGLEARKDQKDKRGGFIKGLAPVETGSTMGVNVPAAAGPAAAHAVPTDAAAVTTEPGKGDELPMGSLRYATRNPTERLYPLQRAKRANLFSENERLFSGEPASGSEDSESERSGSESPRGSLKSFPGPEARPDARPEATENMSCEGAQLAGTRAVRERRRSSSLQGRPLDFCLGAQFTIRKNTLQSGVCPDAG